MTNLRGTYAPPHPTEPHQTGERIVLILVDETTGSSRYAHNYRAVSEIFHDPTGHRVLRVVHEPNWHAWLDAGAGKPDVCPHSQLWPAELVWTE